MLTSTPTMAMLPAPQRPRERLYTHGVEVLADAELLAILLGTGHRGGSALSVAQELLTTFGGLQAVARLHPDELVLLTGIGATKAARISAAFALATRAIGSPARTLILDTADLAACVTATLAFARRERVAVVVLDASRRLRRVMLLTQGAQDECLAPIPEILTAVLLADGACFGLAHNHPSGDVQPSTADQRLTQALAAAADAVHLEFLGHVIVSGREWTAIPVDPIL